MSFNSYTFLLFIIIFLIFYLKLNNYRIIVLVTGSLIFYLLNSYIFFPLFLSITIVTYFISVAIQQQSKQRVKRFYLISGIIFIVFVLITFKYFLRLTHFFNFEEASFLPFGLSYFSFMLINFLIEIYVGTNNDKVKLIELFAFSSFFPTISSGPILKYEIFYHQLKKINQLKSSLNKGLKRFLIGLALKVVIVENLSPMYHEVWIINYSFMGPLDIITIAFISGIYIYLDFSAYSHMAIGVASMLGLVIPENFYFPYHSIDPQTFWKRWHMSLSNWLFDNVFQNVQMKLHKHFKRSIISTNIISLSLTFIICGIWHGNSWNFLFWGLYHALIISFYYLFGRHLKKYINRIFLWCINIVLIMLGWLFFSCTDLNKLSNILLKLFDFGSIAKFGMRENIYLSISILFICTMLTYPIKNIIEKYLRKNIKLLYILETAFYTILLSLSVIYFSSENSFIYLSF